MASSLLLPLWITSLFSRHFICSSKLSQLKTSEAYISSNPDVPASWRTPRHSWENIHSQPTSLPTSQSPSVVPTVVAHREEAQVSQAWWHLWACASEEPLGGRGLLFMCCPQTQTPGLQALGAQGPSCQRGTCTLSLSSPSWPCPSSYATVISKLARRGCSPASQQA